MTGRLSHSLPHSLRRPLAVAALLAGTAALGGCASGPGYNSALEQARTDYAAALNDPQVAKNAPQPLAKAGDALRQAERAATDGLDEAEVSSRAYVASRQVALAREAAAAEGARDTVERAEQARGSAMLQARNAELERQIRELQAEQTERGLVMTLGDVLFATGRADLTPGAWERVDRLAQFLQRYPGRTVRVEGYADSTGSSGFNLDLSERRAEAVRSALLSRGVGPSRVTAQGFGEARPVASNATDSGRQANRRVEIVISDPGTVAQTVP
ncbi:outer membrane protein OmpA-like peptidoglycan-associated protein [Azospirillum fermentarium]|uniref:OmpA family protein n=1 Tax=Azospirillum fermentarium TaxID=1233114 RepID=UPI0022261112|nr:OmpA family protein [Azospirillum fermentarium]MCW2245254.1 outer membrane protein OmpA-like peptidoglycan-associated protein [Azospirillum fermentarium]